MSAELKAHRTDSRAVREMLIRLQDDTYQRVKDLRRDQQQESESEPGDETDLSPQEISTHQKAIRGPIWPE
jgi:hypothetical protein